MSDEVRLAVFVGGTLLVAGVWGIATTLNDIATTLRLRMGRIEKALHSNTYTLGRIMYRYELLTDAQSKQIEKEARRAEGERRTRGKTWEEKEAEREEAERIGREVEAEMEAERAGKEETKKP